MSTKILLLGVLDSILADVEQQVARPDLEVFRGTSVEDVRSTLARTNIDHVIMGGGIPLETRLQMVREQLGSTTLIRLRGAFDLPQALDLISEL